MAGRECTRRLLLMVVASVGGDMSRGRPGKPFHCLQSWSCFSVTILRAGTLPALFSSVYLALPHIGRSEPGACVQHGLEGR